MFKFKSVLTTLAALSFGSILHAATVAVTISSGVLQPGTTIGFHVSSGTVHALNVSTLTTKSSPTNVKWFGAKGDGSTNDTTAIRAAIAYASTTASDVVYFPPGSYNFTGATIPTHVSLIGDGAKTSVLRYTPTSGDALFIADRVNNITGLKIYAPNNSSGSAIRGGANDVTDFTLDQYEIEGFLRGIYIPDGLQIRLGAGRIIGQGSSVAGSIGIQLGSVPGTTVVNTCEFNQTYVSQFSTGILSICSIAIAEQITLESIKVGILNAGRLFVNSSWIQADNYIFSVSTPGSPITATQNYLLDINSTEIDDLTGYVNLATATDLAAFNRSTLVSPGPWQMRFQDSYARGLKMGTIDNLTLYSDLGTLVIKSSSTAPFAVDKDTGSALMNFRLAGVAYKYMGISAAKDLVFLSSTTSTVMLTLTDKGNIVVNQAVATNATDGFIYVTGTAGTPTGAPTAYTGRVPIVVDTTNHKLYFYSGGSWRDAGP